MFKFKKNTIIYISIIILLISITLSPNDSFNAAKQGLLLWFNVLIPALLPFIIVSNLIIKLNIVKYISYFFAPLMNWLYNLPGICGYPWIVGMLCGYPLGAKITSDLYKEKYITKNQAQYLLTFCNNASPMFVLGFVSVGIFNDSTLGFWLLLILYISNFITSIIFKFIYQPNKKLIKHNNLITTSKTTASIPQTFDSSISDGIDLIVRIGGYVIFFSIVLNLISFIPINNQLLKTFLLGVIELTNGIELIAHTNALLSYKIIIITSLIAFGGLSIHAQTSSIISQNNLSTSKYIFAKTINSFITFVISLFFFLFFF